MKSLMKLTTLWTNIKWKNHVICVEIRNEFSFRSENAFEYFIWIVSI